jgi:hypothetical protein
MNDRQYRRNLSEVSKLLKEQKKLVNELKREQRELNNTTRKNLSGIKGELNKTRKDLNTLKMTAEATTGDVLNRSYILFDEFKSLTEGMLTNAVGTFTGILEQALSSLGGGGGIFDWLGGLFSFLPFLQEGGVIKGSEKGVPAVIGENYTDEVVLPLHKLSRMLSADDDKGQRPTTIREGDIHIHIEGSLIHQDELEDIIYRSARKARINAMKRT